jgi:hypothetical protein
LSYMRKYCAGAMPIHRAPRKADGDWNQPGVDHETNGNKHHRDSERDR